MTTEQKLQIALKALQLIQEDASRPAHEVRQKMCEMLARKALERIASIGDSAQAKEVEEETVHEPRQKEAPADVFPSATALAD